MMVRCNQCGAEFDEDYIVLDFDAENDLQIEHCPKCNSTGCLMDLPEKEEKE